MTTDWEDAPIANPAGLAMSQPGTDDSWTEEAPVAPSAAHPAPTPMPLSTAVDPVPSVRPTVSAGTSLASPAVPAVPGAVGAADRLGFPGADVEVGPIQLPPTMPAPVSGAPVPVPSPAEGEGKAAGGGRRGVPGAFPVVPEPERGVLDIDIDTDPYEPEPVPVVAEPKKAGKGKKDKAASKTLPGGVRLTPRDYQLLAFLARYRFATVGQLARRFATSETALRNRLPKLETAGLLTWAWTAATKPKVWMVTDAGLKTAGMQLTTPQVKWATMRHTLGLVDLGILFEDAKEIVVTEREIRAAATRYTPTARMKTAIDLAGRLATLPAAAGTGGLAEQAYTVPMPGRGFGHIPDLVLVRQPYPNGASGSIAVELELNRKTLSDWKAILTAYLDSPVFAQVVYYTMDAEVHRALTGVVAGLGAEAKIQVVAYTPVDRTADPNNGG